MTYDEAVALINLAGFRAKVVRSQTNDRICAIDIFRRDEWGGAVRVMGVMMTLSAAQKEIIRWVQGGMQE